jgi:hypothetical protein
MTTPELLLTLAALLGWGLIVGFTSALTTVYLTRRRRSTPRAEHHTPKRATAPAHPQTAKLPAIFDPGRAQIQPSPEARRRNREAS